jgi:predicted nucleic acid-binding protein
MILVDTSVLVDMLRKGVPATGYISVVTLIEFLRGVDEARRLETKTLLEEAFNIAPIDNEVVLEYCRLYEGLRRKGLNVGMQTCSSPQQQKPTNSPSKPWTETSKG